MEGSCKCAKQVALTQFASIAESLYVSAFKAVSGSELERAVTENFESQINKSCSVTSSARCTLMLANLTVMLCIDSK